MALQIWLPLNNSIHNQGLLGDFTVGTSPTYVDGKIGKAMSGGSLTMTAEQTNLVLNNNAFSICFWIYPNQASGTSHSTALFGNDGMTAPNNRRFWLYHYPTCNLLHLSWQNYDSNSAVLSYISTTDLMPSYTWTHVAVTYNKTDKKVIIYKNGEVFYTYTNAPVFTSPNYSFTTTLMKNDSTRYLNDYRVYDNCLTASEVKEISKGLVAHYTLGSVSLTSSGNLINGLAGGGLCTVSGNSINVSGTNSDTYFYIKTTKAMTSGKLYRLSCIGSGFPASALYNFPIAGQSNTGPGQIKIKNGPCMLTFVANDACANAGTNIMMDDASRRAGAGTISGLCLEEINSVADSSGYCRNLTITGNVSCDSNTPRYDEAILFPANETSRLSSSLSVDPNAWTISFWEKCDWTNVETSSPYIVYWGNYIRIRKHSTNGRMRALYYYKDSEGTQTNTQPYFMSAIGTDTSWKCFTLTFDGSTLRAYLNGTLNASANLSSGFSLYDIDENFRLNYTAETIPKSLSDVRVYATALSADDVLELYNLGASIS